jgi:hypothetical protein
MGMSEITQLDVQSQYSDTRRERRNAALIFGDSAFLGIPVVMSGN